MRALGRGSPDAVLRTLRFQAQTRRTALYLSMIAVSILYVALVAAAALALPGVHEVDGEDDQVAGEGEEARVGARAERGDPGLVFGRSPTGCFSVVVLRKEFVVRRPVVCVVVEE